MNPIARIAASLCVVCLFAGAARAADDPVAEARAAIEKANARFSEAFARADGQALAAMYTSGAILLPPGEDAVHGNAAIGQYWKKAREGGVTSAKLVTTDVGRSGDVAYETGNVQLTIESPGKPAASATEKYVVVWMRQADGSWKLHRDIWNDLPAAKK